MGVCAPELTWTPSESQEAQLCSTYRQSLSGTFSTTCLTGLPKWLHNWPPTLSPPFPSHSTQRCPSWSARSKVRSEPGALHSDSAICFLPPLQQKAVPSHSHRGPGGMGAHEIYGYNPKGWLGISVGDKENTVEVNERVAFVSWQPESIILVYILLPAY